MFTIDMLPAQRGDALWIEYGDPEDPHRVLIDGGIKRTSKTLRDRIEKLPEKKRRFDLLVITHIDLDHIAGVLELLRNPPAGFEVDDVWFNAWEHLEAAQKIVDEGILGSKMGESVSALIKARNYPWNKFFNEGPVAILDDMSLPRKTLAGGMHLTLLSPTAQRLKNLMPAWRKEVEDAGLEPGGAGETLEGLGHPEEVADDGILGAAIDIRGLSEGPFKGDASPANGSSIAFLAEFEEKRCLFAGDAYATDLADAVKRAIAEENDGSQLKIGALKLSHHGGRKNTSATLLQRLRCPRYLFSTDGSSYDHPHDESVARVIVHGARPGEPRPSLIFNYRSDETKRWDDKELFDGDDPYEPIYPDADKGITVEL
jgi:beta-lactamase superfamily II metal-dependent hydrolase